jgi:hypothetical protein
VADSTRLEGNIMSSCHVKKERTDTSLDFELLWLGTALASGIGVIVTLIAGAGAIARGGVVVLCVMGSIFFVSTAIGLDWIKINRPLPIKTYAVSALVILCMSALGWYAWPTVTNEQKQLDRIEKSLEEHGAHIYRSRIKPALEIVLNGVPTGKYVWMMAGKPIVMNIYFKNSGSISADLEQPTCSRAYISSLNPISATKTEWSAELSKFQAEFEGYEAVCKKNLKPGGAIDSGGGEIMISAANRENMEQSDIEALTRGDKTALLFSTITYSDPTGQHYQHYCNWVQKPAFDPPLFEQCGVFYGHR